MASEAGIVEPSRRIRVSDLSESIPNFYDSKRCNLNFNYADDDWLDCD